MTLIITRGKTYLAEVVSETKKVVWPTRQQLLEHSIVVVGAIVVALAIVAVIDYGLSYAVKYFISGV